MEKELVERAYEEIKKVLGDKKVRKDPVELYCYSFDASIYKGNPDIVVRTSSAYEVSEVVKIANKYKIPVVPRGAGTGLTGGACALYGGIVLDLMAMNRIKEINIDNQYVVVEPGIIYDDLNLELASYGFFFPPAPGSGSACSVGGMVANNASGMRAVKYGTTRNYVLKLEVVMPDGNIITTGSLSSKSSAGYSLKDLFVGSEGTLGVITEITLRIKPLPKHSSALIVSFNNVREAGKAASEILKTGIVPAGMEILSEVCIEAVKRVKKIEFPEGKAILFIETDGDDVCVKNDTEKIIKVCKENNALFIQHSEDKAEIKRMMAGRKALSPSLFNYDPRLNPVFLAEDIGVPISSIPDAIEEIEKIASEEGLVIAVFGHIGDGNLHPRMLIDVRDEETWKRADRAAREIYKIAKKYGGTIAGEHGVGITRAQFLKLEHGESLEIMRKIKRALDPNNIMNPGLLFDYKETQLDHLRYRETVL
ncbi:MAG: FAD-binding oxidoreductase [Candidatus Hydrothermarchaeota archaeon]